MKQVATALLAITCFMLCAAGQASAQVPNPVTIGFRNYSNFPVIVQGYSVVNGVLRRGPTLQVPKKGMAFESNVPSGPRYYSIYDATQPQRILLRDAPVPVQRHDLLFGIVNSPADPQRVVLLPANQ